MSTIGTLNVKLKADATEWKSDLSRASQMLGGFGSSLSLIAIPAAIVGAELALANKAVHDFIETTKEMDDIGDAADRLDMSAESLNKLRHAAVLSDASFESLLTGLTKFGEHVGEAALGNKELQESFIKAGLSSQELAKLGRTEGFLATADALSKVENRYEQAALAKSIFGKGASELIPLLRQGSDAIRQLGEEVLTTNEAFRQADIADKQAKKLNESWMAFKQNMAGEVLPAVNDVLEKLNGMGGRGTGGGVGSLIGKMFMMGPGVGVAAWQRDMAERFAPSAKPNEPAVGVDLEAMRSAKRAEEEAKAEKKLGDEISKVKDELALQLGTWGWTTEAIEQRKLASAGASLEDQKQIRAAREHLNHLKDIAAAQEKLIDNMFEWGQFSQQVWRETRTPLEDFQSKLDDLGFAFQEDLLSPETLQRGVGSLAQSLIDAAGESKLQLPTGLERGSAAAVSAINQNIAGQKLGNDPVARLERAMKQLEQKAELQRRFAEETTKILRERLPDFVAQAIPE